jgi:hypothetical protein
MTSKSTEKLTPEGWKPATPEEIDEFNSGFGLSRATPDERLAHIFLAGRVWRRELTVKDRKGKDRVKRKAQLHFLQGGKAEARGREALIRVLEASNLPSFLVHDLTVLFDEKVRKKALLQYGPEDPELRGTYSLKNETRRLKFVYRSRNPRNNLTDGAIWMFMHPSNGKRPPIKDAERFFGLSRTAIYNALNRVKERFPARAGK